MPSPIQKNPCHLGTLAQDIVTVLVSGAQGLPGTFLVAGKHSKASILETQGTCLAGLGEFSTLGLWERGTHSGES